MEAPPAAVALYAPDAPDGVVAPDSPVTWRLLLARAETELGRGNEARWVLERASGLEGAELVAALDEAAPARSVCLCAGMVRRRRSGEPLQYVLGRWGFRGLDLLVDRRAFIPRPETETLVDVARGELSRLRATRGADQAAPRSGDSTPRGGQGLVAVDLGTGSGAIALSLATEEPALWVWGTELSVDALAVARTNLAGLGGRAAARVRLVRGDWFGALPSELAGRVDLVVSNPPYVAEGEELPAEVIGWEPRSALVAGADGLDSIRQILAGAPSWLGRPGALVVEIAPCQAEAAVDLALRAGFAEAEVRPDLAGRDRVLVGRTQDAPLGGAPDGFLPIGDPGPQ